MSLFVDFQVGPDNPSIVGGVASTSVQYFPRLLNATRVVNQLTSPVGGQSPSPSATSAVGQLSVPGNNVLDGQTFTVRAAGDFGSDTGDPSGLVTISLYANTSPALPSPIYTQIATTGAVTPGYASAEPWSIVATLQGTSLSGLVGGTYMATVGGQRVGAAGQNTTNVLSGINFNPPFPFNFPPGSPLGQPGYTSIPFGFVVGVRFSTGDPTNVASLYQFQLVQN
jgi:hypothetical protein